ncbi:MAG: hypothetical protein ACW964_15105 [Candidatus Hodarchaeales archaeon]
MKKKIICFSVCMLLLATYAGAVSSPNVEFNKSVNSNPYNDYSHTILGEYFTLEGCTPSRYSHMALMELYYSEYHPFYYVSMVYDENKWANQRADELDVYVSPTLVWDGGYLKDIGSNEDIKADMADYNESIIACGNRNVKDIDLNLDVEWLGVVNIIPENGTTEVPIDQVMSWSNSEMEIDVEVINHETETYNGHLHVYVTEVNSTLWDDKWGNPYTFAFLDYAWNEDVTLSGSGAWEDTVIWDGYDHQTGYGDYYQNITQDNILLVASIFDEDNFNYADETTGVRTGYDTDPKLYDIYFGCTFPPPLIFENVSTNKYIPGDLGWNVTYYWRIDVKDANGNIISTDFMYFTTRDNNPPYAPGWECPVNGSNDVPICGNLSWIGGDPDGDDVTYDVYFSDDPENMKQVTWNLTENGIVMDNLNFNKTYYWYVVAWDEYGYYKVGPLWSFTTEENLPPNPAENPYPPDGHPSIPVEGVILKWNGSDPNLCDEFRYNLFFDDVNPPLTQVLAESFQNFYGIPFTLPKYKTYYWRVDTYDKTGEFTEGYVWSFTTGDNNPPTDPLIKGPKTKSRNRVYKFTFMSTDPENHTIQYLVDWDDGTEDLTDFYPSGEEVTLSHSWAFHGSVRIRAKAIDQYGAESNWSDLLFSVPKTFNLQLIDILFARFPNTFLILQQLLIYMKI